MNIEFKGPIYPEKPHSSEDEPEIISVDQEDGWKIAKAPNIIETSSLGPCVGIIIFDPESQQAMVGHFPDPVNSAFPDMLDQALEIFPDPKKIKNILGRK